MKEQSKIPTSKVRRASKLIGTGAKVGGNYVKYFANKAIGDKKAKEKLDQENAADIYQSLSELKGSALKMAQVISMDKNMLPKAMTDKFAQAQYNAPPLSYPLVVKTFRQMFGKTPTELFDFFMCLVKGPLKNISSLIEFAKKNKIKFLTLFVFSLDNWKRSKKEVNFLFNLLEKFLDKNIEELIKKKIKIKSIGERKKLSKKLINKIKKVEKLSSMNYDITVNLAFNYSSKTEIIESFKKSIKQKVKITKDTIKKNLYTKNIPDPELLIRTGGQNRLSDFMLWQMSYTEIFFLKKLWPDFNKNDFKKILQEYKKIKRNFGSIDD